MENNSENTYIEYVNSIIKDFGYIKNIVHKGEVTPQALNTALALYGRVGDGLIAEYQRIKEEHLKIDLEYNAWYDQKFEEARTEIINEYSNVKGVKPSVKEFDTRVRTKFAFEYETWQRKLRESEGKIRFLIRIMDNHKKFDGILVTLSSNMRQEMRSLSLDSRMNSNPSQYKVRREFSDNTDPQIDLESFPFIGYCSACGEKVYDTPSGSTCKNGHGGADVFSEPFKKSNRKAVIS